MDYPIRLKDKCNYCGVQVKGLIPCPECHYAFYCSRKHMEDDLTFHDTVCWKILHALEELKVNQAQLENYCRTVENFPLTAPSQALVGEPGLCYCYIEAQPYVYRRFSLVGALREIGTRRALKTALVLNQETLKIARCDHVVIRDLNASLLVGFGRTQEAYDFIQFWLINKDRYDCRVVPALPYLNIVNADPFKPFDKRLLGPKPLVGLVVILTLIKFKLLLDVQNIRNAHLLLAKVNYDCVDNIKRLVSSTDVTRNRPDIRRIDSITKYEQLIRSLGRDLDLLFWYCGNRHQNDGYQLWKCIIAFHKHFERKCGDIEHCATAKITEGPWTDFREGPMWIRYKLIELGIDPTAPRHFPFR
ncbi:hypothetical protein ABW19_dt0205072 [Dactylella cylindrospora]|nr:hypothetical protein ABW19_dt0205072 [Dactylella cylindrospora]